MSTLTGFRKFGVNKIGCSPAPHTYAVEHEYPVGSGKTVDLHAIKQGRELVVEVETGRSDIPANIHKCTGLPGTVIFFFTTPEAAREHAILLDSLGIQIVTPETIDNLDTLG